MPSGPIIILTLKIAVVAVSLLLAAALIALARGNTRLHGRINLIFFVLTMSVVLAFEMAVRFGPTIEEGWSVTKGWTPNELTALRVHLCFVIPLTFLLPVMLFTGWRRKRRVHVTLAILFAMLWTGMLITGLFFLPHNVRY